MMTRYSAHEHSQPRDAPVWLPAPDELMTDIQRLKDWRNSFDSRTGERH
jgi:hypothetical protein